MSLGVSFSGGSVSSGGNATVPPDAFIQPPQAYVDWARYCDYQLFWNGAGLELSNKGITRFVFRNYLGDIIDLNSFTTYDLSLNKMDSDAVVEFFSDALAGIVPDTNTTFLAHGPNMGCPLTGGAVGGWSIDLADYVVGITDGMAFQGSYIGHNGSQSVSMDGLQNFADSAVVTVEPEGWASIVIGVQDLPTKAQILAKISELFLSINPGSTEIAGTLLTYTDTIARAWIVGGASTLLGETASGADPTNADIDALVAAACSGSFTGPDGVTQINF